MQQVLFGRLASCARPFFHNGRCGSARNQGGRCRSRTTNAERKQITTISAQRLPCVSQVQDYPAFLWAIASILQNPISYRLLFTSCSFVPSALITLHPTHPCHFDASFMPRYRLPLILVCENRCRRPRLTAPRCVDSLGDGDPRRRRRPTRPRTPTHLFVRAHPGTFGRGGHGPRSSLCPTLRAVVRERLACVPHRLAYRVICHVDRLVRVLTLPALSSSKGPAGLLSTAANNLSLLTHTTTTTHTLTHNHTHQQ